MIRRKIITIISMGLLVVVLFGCAQTTMVESVNNNDYMGPDGTVKVQLLETEMWAYAGLRETKAIKEGYFSVYKARFPADLFKEIFPGRTTYYGWVINQETKKEFFTQLLVSGFDEDNIPFVQMIIDGDASTGMIPEKCYFLNLSTKFNRAYDVGGTMHSLIAESFSKLPEYRLEKIIAYGDKISSLKTISNGKEIVYDILANWSSFERNSDGIIFYTPLNEVQMKQLAQLNPQYDFWNKYKYNAKVVLTPNYVAMGISTAFDVVISANAPSWGPDFDSSIKRDDMGLAMEYVLALSRQNSQKVAELMYERMVREMFDEGISFKVKTTPSQQSKKLIEEAVLSSGVNTSDVWRDYQVDGNISQEKAIKQLRTSLEMLGISKSAITKFKTMVISGNREYKYLTIDSGDNVSMVVLNEKVIYQHPVVVRWKKDLRRLSVKRYRIINNKDANKKYSIGLTDSGHWVRFKYSWKN